MSQFCQARATILCICCPNLTLVYVGVGCPASRYSTETNRMHSDYNVTLFDFWDTYLPQYKRAFTEASVRTRLRCGSGLAIYLWKPWTPVCTH
eukprot:SAG22_NODE_8762_length_631_cov_1.554511_1_plen_93_part_00